MTWRAPATYNCDSDGTTTSFTPITHGHVEGSDRWTQHALTLLTSAPNLTCDDQVLDVLDLMGVFEADAAAGWPTEWEVGSTGYGARRFNDRVGDIMFGSRDYTNFRWQQARPTTTAAQALMCPPQCVINQVQDGDETGVDCGGACGSCPDPTLPCPPPGVTCASYCMTIAGNDLLIYEECMSNCLGICG